MLTLVHSNPALIRNGVLTIDRKFLTGMHHYAASIDAQMLTLHPKLAEGEAPIDLVEVALADLPFEVRTVPAEEQGEVEKIRQRVKASTLIYGSLDLGVAPWARAANIPYVLVREYDLDTQVQVTTSQVSAPLRRLVRRARCSFAFHRHSVPQMRRAAALHCNGFPVYDESAIYNTQRLLYLDSRMSAKMVISEDRLRARRLQKREVAPLKLLYSGRYEPMKGSLDSVKVAIECLKRGLNIEFHSYGQGSLLNQMRAMAAQAKIPDRIFVHDAIPYPELVERSRDFDIFVCCHVQSDPSCTYLESFGSGLPIVGYGNRMWARLCEVSGCGASTAIGNPAAVATEIGRLQADEAQLTAMSLSARTFALAHTFEREFSLRTNAINALLTKIRGRNAAAGNSRST